MGVKVYFSPTCPHCNKLLRWLGEKGVKFESVDVSEDKQAAKEMIDKSGEYLVPVVDVNGQVVTGFKEKELKKLLKIK